MGSNKSIRRDRRHAVNIVLRRMQATLDELKISWHDGKHDMLEFEAEQLKIDARVLEAYGRERQVSGHPDAWEQAQLEVDE